jgi:hypothetical protein
MYVSSDISSHLQADERLIELFFGIQNPSKTDFEHELEIEISAAEVRRQGDLAMSGDSQNEYENLIKGFVDNIRVLARSVPSQ